MSATRIRSRSSPALQPVPGVLLLAMAPGKADFSFSIRDFWHRTTYTHDVS
jgi:hypothetical protein